MLNKTIRHQVEWLAVVLSIGTTFFRALNLGYVPQSYALSGLAYIMFALTADRPQQQIANVAYLGVAVLGIWQWTQISK